MCTPAVPGYAGVVGDLVGSRRHADRAGLQGSFEAAVAAANRRIPALQRLQVAAGDECRGLFATVEDALDATLIVRLALAGVIGIRFGIGWGPITTFDPARVPLRQDGPAWSGAHAALARARDSERRRVAARGPRTVFVVASGTAPAAAPESLPGPATALDLTAEAPVNAFLACRDHLLAGMDGRDARLLLALLDNEKQEEVAAREGITQPAVSQRNARSGAYAIKEGRDIMQREHFDRAGEAGDLPGGGPAG